MSLMDELFEKQYHRPNKEVEVIKKFVVKYTEAKSIYKEGDYKTALDKFSAAFDLLTDIWDIFPKNYDIIFYNEM